MSLVQKIEDDLKAAMRDKDELRKNTLRMVKADLGTEKAKTGNDLSDEQSLEVIGRCAKKRKEAIAEFTKAGRNDLASKEAEELSIIEQYLPKQMTEEEINAYVSSKLSSMGQVTSKESGKVMGEIMKELKGKADGNLVKKAVMSKLEGK